MEPAGSCLIAAGFIFRLPFSTKVLREPGPDDSPGPPVVSRDEGSIGVE
jgi:hypothetical protein